MNGYMLAAIIGIIGTFTAAFIGLVVHTKLKEIHILVNSRLDQALEEIKDLKQQRDLKQKGVE